MNTALPAQFYSTGSHANEGLWGSTDRMDSAYGLGGVLGDVGLGTTSGLEVYGTEVVAALTTTITGLPSGKYKVYAVFVTMPGSTDGDIYAALSGGTLGRYTHANITDTIAGTGAFNLSIIELGTTPSTTSIAVDIDDNPLVSSRTIFVGVAYYTSALDMPGTLIYGK